MKVAIVQDWLTVIGEPVVYACRLSGGKPGKTLLNQQAYVAIQKNLGGYIDLQEEELDIKHMGTVKCYSASRSKKKRKLNSPKWFEEIEIESSDT